MGKLVRHLIVGIWMRLVLALNEGPQGKEDRLAAAIISVCLLRALVEEGWTVERGIRRIQRIRPGGRKDEYVRSGSGNHAGIDRGVCFDGLEGHTTAPEWVAGADEPRLIDDACAKDALNDLKRDAPIESVKENEQGISGEFGISKALDLVAKVFIGFRFRASETDGVAGAEDSHDVHRVSVHDGEGTTCRFVSRCC